MRYAARWAVAAVSLAIVLAAVVGAARLYERSWNDRATGHRAQLYRDAQRLRDISTALAGSTLPPARAWCERWVRVDRERTGHQYPVRGSADWDYVMSVCTGHSR